MPSKADATLVKAAKENFDAISGSDSFFVLFNAKMVEETIPLLQMGLAIYLDKPIALLVPQGAEIPMNLRRVALAIEEFDPTDLASMKPATERLFSKLNI